MYVYRLVKARNRTTDLSGTGAFLAGGRWNSKGTYMLYTSENSSLALLETLVHVDPADLPPNLFLMKIEVAPDLPIHILPDEAYPSNWLLTDLLANKRLGDALMQEKKWGAIRIRSAVNTTEYNILLNPLFPHFHDKVHVIEATEIRLDERLVT